MSVTIQVVVKSVYGNKQIHPHCHLAHLFTKLLGQKTLTEANVAVIKELGYEVRVVSDQPEKL